MLRRGNLYRPIPGFSPCYQTRGGSLRLAKLHQSPGWGDRSCSGGGHKRVGASPARLRGRARPGLDQPRPTRMLARDASPPAQKPQRYRNPGGFISPARPIFQIEVVVALADTRMMWPILRLAGRWPFLTLICLTVSRRMPPKDIAMPSSSYLKWTGRRYRNR